MSFQFPRKIRGIVGYEEEYYVKVEDIPIPICNTSLKIVLPATLYSLPSNDKKTVNTKILLEKSVYIDKIAMYYGKYPIGAIVEGKIVSGCFVINKIVKHPKSIV